MSDHREPPALWEEALMEQEVPLTEKEKELRRRVADELARLWELYGDDVPWRETGSAMTDTQ